MIESNWGPSATQARHPPGFMRPGGGFSEIRRVLRDCRADVAPVSRGWMKMLGPGCDAPPSGPTRHTFFIFAMAVKNVGVSTVGASDAILHPSRSSYGSVGKITC